MDLVEGGLSGARVRNSCCKAYICHDVDKDTKIPIRFRV
jgi:hypothetical protein